MKKILLTILLLAAWPALSAQPPLTATAGTNEMIITCDNGFTYNGTNAIYQGNVHVTDPQMELLCELLTFVIETNNNTIDLVLAETNVVIIQSNTWAIGDKAFYNLTNDIIELTGNVLMDDARGSAMGAKVIYDRKKNNMFMPGHIIMVSQYLASTNKAAFITPLRDKPRKP
jgi:lipopolysaccharide export system protein LptA